MVILETCAEYQDRELGKRGEYQGKLAPHYFLSSQNVDVMAWLFPHAGPRQQVGIV